MPIDAKDKGAVRLAGALYDGDDKLNSQLPIAQACLEANCLITVLRFQFPDDHPVYPGLTYDALAFGPANAEDSAEAAKRTVAYLQAKLAEIAAQLDAL